jgi:hypothetical protein
VGGEFVRIVFESNVTSLIENSGSNEDISDSVRIAVGRWSSILEVSTAVVVDKSRDSDGATSVGSSVGEIHDGGSLVETSESSKVVSATLWIVSLDVKVVSASEFLDSFVDDFSSTWLSHGLSGVVDVATSAVPVTLNRLRVEAADDTEVLGNSAKEVSGHPELITHFDSFAGSNLELPLGRHDLGVGARDLDASVEASSVVSLDNISAVDVVGSNSAVVRALGSGITLLGPSVRVAINVEHGPFLLHAEPWLLVLDFFHDSGARSSVVSTSWLLVGVEDFGKDEDVRSSSEGIWEDSNRLEVAIRVGTLGLASGGTVVVPLWELRDILGHLGQGSGLSSHGFTSTIDPDVHGLDIATGVQVHVMLKCRFA